MEMLLPAATELRLTDSCLQIKCGQMTATSSNLETQLPTDINNYVVTVMPLQ